MNRPATITPTTEPEERVELPGWLSLRSQESYLHVRSSKPLRTAGSAPYGGGLGKVRHILAVKVDERLDCARPELLLRAKAAELSLDEAFVGLLTGVSLARVKVAVREASGTPAMVFVTAGGRNLAAASLSPVWRASACGTINTIAIIDARLADAALLNLLIVATEAKTLVLRERGVLTEEGFPATGTSTDAVVVGCTENGPRQWYGGPVTLPGHLIGAAVLAATRAALNDCSIGEGQA